MNYNDIWRTAKDNLGFFTYANRDQIPASPGIYAWFLPLKLKSKLPEELIEEANLLMYYDSLCSSKPVKESEVGFCWDTIGIKIEKKPPTKSSYTCRKKWDKLSDKLEALDKIRKALMLSSIFASPLYVGRTNALDKRYMQHVSGSDCNDFHSRFIKFTQENNANIRIEDLLFVCIKTDFEED